MLTCYGKKIGGLAGIFLPLRMLFKDFAKIDKKFISQEAKAENEARGAIKPVLGPGPRGW